MERNSYFLHRVSISMPQVRAESAVFFGIGLFGDHVGGVTDASSINHPSSLSPDDQTKEATCAPDITADRVTMPTEERPTDRLNTCQSPTPPPPRRSAPKG